jgi:DNA repair exonuclease SbcCD ATPase subunit
MSISATLVRKLTEIDPPLREAMLLLVEEMERQQEQMAQQVTKAELRELQEVVQELAVSVNRLAEAQVRTEERLNELATTQARTEERLNELAAVERLAELLNELAAAQARTEERLERLEAAVERLAEAQARTEERLNELAAAQARTEERLERLEAAVERLAEAQARTEERLNELAAAQARTEEELRKLAAEHRVTRERLEGISNTVGYTLEDRAYKALPAILAQQGIQVEGRLIRRYVQLKEKERQVDIFGHGRRNGEQVLILGEAKVRPSRREVDRFVRLARQVAAVERMPPVLVFVAYDFPPAVEAYIKEQDILPVWSYELE